MSINGSWHKAPLGYWEGKFAFVLPFVNACATFWLCCNNEVFARLITFWLHASPWWMLRTFLAVLYPPAPPPPPPPDAKQLFIVPSYMEPIEVLRKSLDMLARHKRARKSYIVVLAMESRELATSEGQAKRESLLDEYGKGERFSQVLSSSHELAVGEVASKCSNVSAAVRHVVATLGPSYLKKSVVTIMDADSLLLEAYVERAAGLVMAAPEDQPAMPWPPMAFPPLRLRMWGGDAGPGNWLAGCFDCVWQGIVFSGAGRPTPVKMPAAVYSLRLDVLLDAGIDTTPEGVGEDMMMAMRAFTARGAHGVFVPIPFGSQRCKELKIRLHQTLRHAFGTVGLRAAALSVVRRPGLGSCVLLFQAMEVSALFAVILWLGLFGQPMISRMTYFEWILMIGGGLISTLFSFFIQETGYSVFEGRAAHKTLGAQVGHWLCFLICFPVAAQLYAVIHLIAMGLMAVKGPAAVSHRPNSAA